MTSVEISSTKFLSKEQLTNLNSKIHEFVLSKDEEVSNSQIEQICAIAPLHQLTIEDCKNGNQRSKFEHYPGYLFFVLHYFETELGQESEIHVVIREGELLIISNKKCPEGFKSWAECLDLLGEKPFAQIMHNIFDNCVDSAERRVARLEDFVTKAATSIVNESFNPKLILQLKQHSLQFQRSVSGTNSVVREFMEMAELTVEQRLWYRNIQDHLERLANEIHFLHSEMLALFDVFWGASGFYANEQIKRLTLIATIGVPLAFWTSFFGMNFEVMPFREPWFFFAALVLMTASMLATYLFLSRQGLFKNRFERSSRMFRELQSDIK
ncbi:MAG: magnesium transporter CorA family protein [Silvanigrellaceae bacterium]